MSALLYFYSRLVAFGCLRTIFQQRLQLAEAGRLALPYQWCTRWCRRRISQIWLLPACRCLCRRLRWGTELGRERFLELCQLRLFSIQLMFRQCGLVGYDPLDSRRSIGLARAEAPRLASLGGDHAGPDRKLWQVEEDGQPGGIFVVGAL